MDYTQVTLFLQSSPQIKARLPSNATACYALAVSSDGKVHSLILKCVCVHLSIDIRLYMYMLL